MASYTLAWSVANSNELFTLTVDGDVAATWSEGQHVAAAHPANAQWVLLGADGALTTLDWELCTSPSGAASRAALITAINDLADNLATDAITCTTLTSTSTTQSTSSTTGGIIGSGGLGLAKNIFTAGNVTATGGGASNFTNFNGACTARALLLSGTTTSSGVNSGCLGLLSQQTLTTSFDQTIVAQVQITAPVVGGSGATITNLATLYLTGAPTATGHTVTNGPFAIQVVTGTSYFGGAITSASTTESTTTSTGALTTLGGIGVAKNITCGGNIAVTGTVDGRDVAADGAVIDAADAASTSYVETWDDFSTSTTSTVAVRRAFGICVVSIPDTSGTSDGVNFGSTVGLPVGYRPTTGNMQFVLPEHTDNGTQVTGGYAIIGTDGSIAFLRTNLASWTGSGTKGIGTVPGTTTFTFPLA